ncbi:MAG: hypothetical protein DDT23_01229 [candidate division WS2 bacterium]|nr:hypothetical protein [Candidatus Lithacetigena glycinireducens]
MKVKTILTLEEALGGGYTVDLWIYDDHTPAGVVASVWYAEKPRINWTRTITGHTLADVNNATFGTVDEFIDKT